jgi:serralysin
MAEKKAKKKTPKEDSNLHHVEGYGIPGPLTEKEIWEVRACVDVFLKEKDHIIDSAERAIKENPHNKPVGVYRASPLEMALITGKKWPPGRTLTVGFLDGNQQNINLVRQHAPYWSNFCSITFKFVSNPAQADVRISFRQAGAWSYIGTDILGIPKNQCTMNFGFIDPTTIKHEFGHTLGCIHEHQHPQASIPWNTQAVYQYFSGPPNSWPKDQIDTNIFQRYNQGETQFDAYDPHSIMHYPFDGRLLTDPSKAVGFNQDLSAEDRSFIGKMYPKSGGGGGDTGGGPGTGDGGDGLPTVALGIPVSGKYTAERRDGKVVLTFQGD